MSEFIKRNPHAPHGFFQTEVAGLQWLGQGQQAGGVAVAEVLAVAQDSIVLRREIQVAPSAAMAHEFGRQLARTHSVLVADEYFGPGPMSDELGRLFIGRLPMPGQRFRNWGEFYARTRVEPFLAAAQDAGNLSEAAARVVLAACELIARGVFDDDAPPRRIHGDLWSGNVLWTAKGVVLIDPAAHQGHGETDLAMLALFSCPYVTQIYAGYNEVLPLVAGWQDRIALHQLHPLAVHAATHGPSYGVELTRAAEQVLALNNG